MSCHKSLPALICAFLYHSLIQKLYSDSEKNNIDQHDITMDSTMIIPAPLLYYRRKHEPSTSSMATTRTDLFNDQCDRSYHIAKGLPVDAIICIATHSGSHLSLTSPMATSMRAVACHKRHLSILPQCTYPAKHMVFQTSVHAATTQTVQDMPAGLLCCASVCRFCFIFFLRFYAQSHSNGHVHPTAPSCTHSLTHSGSGPHSNTVIYKSVGSYTVCP